MMNVTVVSERKAKMKKNKKKKSINTELGSFREEAPEHPPIEDLSQISTEDREVMLKTGIDLSEKKRGGSFLQKDHSVVYCRSNFEGAQIMSVTEAVRLYDGLKDYWWKAVAVDKDIYTTRADIHQENGYFIRSLPEAKVIYPLQACLYLTEDNLAQDVHNIIIAEENSDLNIITGCATSPHVRSGLHVGVSEFYIKKGARISFTMIHNWPEKMAARPRSAAIVEEGGTFISNYICLTAARDLQMYPRAVLQGRGAVATFNTVLLARPGSLLDVGSRVILKEEGCRAEVIARTVSTGGTIIARGHLIGEKPGIKAHLECKGLLLSRKGVIHAIPELEGKTSDVEMSHEAAVGKIAQEEIEYIMARGLTEQEATSLIIKGFLSLEIMGLPSHLKEELNRIIEDTEKEVM